MQPEYINLVAMFAALCGLVSGVWAVGPRGLWDFPSGLKPYAEGNARAWLYAVVIGTTIVAGWHLIMLTDWFLQDSIIKAPIGDTRRYAWHIWHTSAETMITGLHIWARRWREARGDKPATILGAGSDAQ